MLRPKHTRPAYNEPCTKVGVLPCLYSNAPHIHALLVAGVREIMWLEVR